MALPDPRSRVATTLIILLALGAVAVQLVTDQPPLGVVSLILLPVHGFVITQALGPRPLSWPQVLLTTLGTSLVLAVLAGIIAAISAHGLDASSVAGVELVALLGAAIIWLWRLRRGELNLARRKLGDQRRYEHAVFLGSHGQPDLSAPPSRRPRIRVRTGSLLLVVLGLGLGSAGFVVATRAAQDQIYPGFVQFWSVPPRAGAEELLGVRNVTGLALDCQVAIDRPNQPEYDWHIGAIDTGQAWLGQLPRTAVPDTGPWQISLHCAAPNGSTFDRRLSIDPPA